VEAGPVIVARPGKPKIVVIGFHPARSAMRYELATPLLFANHAALGSLRIFSAARSSSRSSVGPSARLSILR